MSKPNSFFARWRIPMAMTLFCLLLAGGAGVAFGPAILFLTILGMPVPLFLFWMSWNVETLEERYAHAQRSAAPRETETKHEIAPRLSAQRAA